MAHRETTLANGLLPCPFCGGTKVNYYPLHSLTTHRDHPFVLCHECSATIKGDHHDLSHGGETAAIAWNTRAALTELKGKK